MTTELVITTVKPLGQADRLGMRSGDVLLTYDGTKTSTNDDLNLAMHSVRNRTAMVVIGRNGRLMEWECMAGPLGVVVESREVMTEEQLEAQRTFDDRIISLKASTFKDVLAPYIDKTIFINVDAPAKVDPYVLFDAQADFFTVRCPSKIHRFPYSQVLSIQEGLFDESLVILVFHLVIYKGAVGFGFTVPLGDLGA